MRIKEYLFKLSGPYRMCDKYADRVRPSNTKTELLELGLDINGMAFLAKMSTSPDKPDYELIRKEFGPYSNGRYVRDNGRYTSSFYLFNSDDVNIGTNLTLFMQCDCRVVVRDYDVVSLYVDSGSKIHLDLGEHSNVTVHTYGDAEVIYSDKLSNNVVIKHDK